MPSGYEAARRIADMADVFRFLDARLPALLDEWHTERTGNPTGGGSH